MAFKIPKGSSVQQELKKSKQTLPYTGGAVKTTLPQRVGKATPAMSSSTKSAITSAVANRNATKKPGTVKVGSGVKKTDSLISVKRAAQANNRASTQNAVTEAAQAQAKGRTGSLDSALANYKTARANTVAQANASQANASAAKNKRKKTLY